MGAWAGWWVGVWCSVIGGGRWWHLLEVTLETLQILMTKKEELQEEGVEAIKDLREWRLIESRLSGFLKPLQSASNRGRVHPQINLHTMTGRVSTRNPNLQGEPTGGDSEMFPARSILAAPPGKRLLVADYAQLELRLVAHLADCTSMIDILQSGGDIHSRTAYKMFEEVKLAVDRGLVVVDEAARDKDVPLVKDHFPELRKKAKTLNFALLYGKTAFSFAIDWNIEQSEAQAVIDRWFQAFPEVKKWMDLAHSEFKYQGQNGWTMQSCILIFSEFLFVFDLIQSSISVLYD